MEYRESIVTFLDILGFSELVNDEDNVEKIDRVLTILKDWTGFDEYEQEKYEQRFSNFSDCCVRSTPVIRSDGEWNCFGLVSQEVLQLSHAILNLIPREKVLVRGAITIGPIRHDESKIYGPALVRAYELEAGIAQFPRVILEPRLVAQMKTNPRLVTLGNEVKDELATMQQCITKGSDGIYFIDYLRLAESENDSGEDFLLFLGKHRDIIQQRSVAFGAKPKLALKFNWLIEYHNTFVSGLNEELLGDLGLQQSDLLVEVESAPFYEAFENF